MRFAKIKLVSSAVLVALFSVNAYGTVLHRERTEQTITKGAVLIKEKVLTQEGWQDMNMLKVDLSDENVAIKPIESDILGQRKTVLDLVNSSGAIAGINADFFDMSTSNTPSLGPVIKDGQLKHGYNNNYFDLGPVKNMATFLLDNSNMPSMEYYGTAVALYANGSLVGGMAAYNNIPTSLSRPIVLDGTYQQDTSKVISKFKGTYTIVIENGQVTYLAKQDEVVAIPADGYVVMMSAKDANAYYTALPIGTAAEIKNTIYLNSETVKAVEEIKMGLGGSGIIMKDGQEYTGAAHKVSGTTRAPRTVIATIKNSNELLLFTIDGRNKTLGANHKDLVALMQSYNVQDAMYFDGGGSTTIVSRTEGDKTVKLLNSPSDGAMRKVVDGLGVFTTSQPGTLSKLYLDTTSSRSFVGEPITFTVKGSDENFNPIAPSNVSMNVNGIRGTFKGYTFYPETAGKALVIANSNGVETAKEIVISEKPAGIRVEPANLQISPNSSKEVQIYGIDKDGYKLPLSEDKVTWKSTSQEVSGNAGRIIAGGKATAVLTATYKGVSAQLGVIVGDTAVPIESFEKNMGVWGGNTTTVQGKVEPSTSIKYEGTKSIKMTYTFAKSANKQVAYTLLKAPIDIPKDAMSINMWLNAQKQGDTAKIEVIDAANKKYFLKVTDALDFNGWKYLSIALPEDMVLPAKVTKFYTYANSVSGKRTSAVYIDHISITRGFRNKQGITVRNDYRFDPLYKEILQSPINGQYVVNVIGPTKTSSMVLNQKSVTDAGAQLSQQASLILFAAQSNIDLPVSAPKYTYNNTYQSFDYNNTKVIFAGTDKGGLRATNANQWLSIKNDIENTAARNILIVMSKNPLTQFDDADEGLAFHKYLQSQRETKGKNIFVVYTGGTEREVRIEDGIRYIRTNGFNVPSDYLKDCSYVRFKMSGNEIYYTFENMH